MMLFPAMNSNEECVSCPISLLQIDIGNTMDLASSGDWYGTGYLKSSVKIYTQLIPIILLATDSTY